MNGQPLLNIKSFSVEIDTPDGTLHALSDINLYLHPGRVLGLVGESGSGKSMLARSIMKLPPVTRSNRLGTIEIEGTSIYDVDGKSDPHFWGMKAAMVFQDPMTSLNPVMRVGNQITESLKFHLGLSAVQAKQRAKELLDQVRIPESARRLRQYPGELSGGMRQRITIAIALSCNPKLLIADEATTALDVTIQHQILELLSDIQKEHQMAMMLISHDLGVVAGHADDIAVMYAGRIIEHASADDLFANTQHPYTKGLLDSLPRLGPEGRRRLQPIPGKPPRNIGTIVGCNFAPRCKYAQTRCLSEAPVKKVPNSHDVECFYPVASSEGVGALNRNLLAGETAAGLRLTDMAGIA